MQLNERQKKIAKLKDSADLLLFKEIENVYDDLDKLDKRIPNVKGILSNIRGKEGVKGKDGLDGKDGINGKDGVDGKNGVDGKDGKDGKNGINGINGINGLDGLNGKNGKDGKDGVNGKNTSTTLENLDDTPNKVDEGNLLIKRGDKFEQISLNSLPQKTIHHGGGGTVEVLDNGVKVISSHRLNFGTGLTVTSESGVATINSTGVSQTLDVLDVYDATGGQQFESDGVLNLDTTRTSNGSLFSIASDVVTINSAATCKVDFRVSANLVSGTRTGLGTHLEIDTGSGFVAVPGSYSFAYSRESNINAGTAVSSVVMNFSAGDKIRVIVTLENPAVFLTTIAGASGLTIYQLNGIKGDTGTTGLTFPYTAKTGTYTITSDDYLIDCTGTFTVTLPTAVGITGRQYVVKNSGTGEITVDGDGTETIDGGLTAILTTQYESITLVSDGANWIII